MRLFEIGNQSESGLVQEQHLAADAAAVADDDLAAYGITAVLPVGEDMEMIAFAVCLDVDGERLIRNPPEHVEMLLVFRGMHGLTAQGLAVYVRQGEGKSGGEVFPDLLPDGLLQLAALRVACKGDDALLLELGKQIQAAAQALEIERDLIGLVAHRSRSVALLELPDAGVLGPALPDQEPGRDQHQSEHGWQRVSQGAVL